MSDYLDTPEHAAAAVVVAGEFTVAGVADALLTIAEPAARLRDLYRIAVQAVRRFGFGRRLLRSELATFFAANDVFQQVFELAVEVDFEPVPRMQPALQLSQPCAVPVITTVVELCDWLGIYGEELSAWTRSFRSDHGQREQRFRSYHCQWLPRRGSPPRLIEAPKQRLKDVQRRIANGILRHVRPHGAAHGFVLGRSVSSAVATHVGKRCVLRMDLEDCFASVGSGRVLRTFLSIGYPEDVARCLALLCTTATPSPQLATLAEVRHERADRLREKLRARHLPQGAPTSPALMNLAMYRADARLAGLAKRFAATYSRYADDLLLSGGEDFRRDAERCASHVAAVLLGEGLHVAHHKTRIMFSSQAQRSCGLVLNERAGLPRKERERLEAILHNCVVHGPATQNRSGVPDFHAWLQGKVAHARRFDAGGRLAQLWARIDWSV